MKQTDVGATVNAEVKTVMAEFCQTARSIGSAAAEHAATVHLVAAAAYLGETVGPSVTKQILSAILSSIG
ncbi:hypothetical protein P9273_03390 [Mesorhizobium sp. WSM4935]|uniref:hypothetical protein n=1 Tax=unclassified Mesorhizobium TaxID=325217 RepID=UPI000FD4EB3B|nr:MULTISPECIES: hypothetical protein [unclassified Mesorhizobium]MDG4874141.1 hypothetical protein [Mesorhizobium sp. WSM4935]RUW81528.1 hypothetical protein EOA28_00975 [Mesorhizobium sp. M2A.F.Ca.ET.067.02.1.1]TIU58144.1 MAG: hypothetical protein E5W35_05985 [Mesorhizobium sp.]